MSGTIYLPTLSAVALWKEEITGQLSDGMWENARPHEHWRFWSDLEAVHSPDRCEVVTDRPWACTKASYKLTALVPIVGDRMLAVGQKAQGAIAILNGREIEHYTERSLRIDLKHIKAAMATAAPDASALAVFAS
jgi:hypothetical protein